MDVDAVRVVKAGAKSQVVVSVDSDSHPTLDELEVLSNELSDLFDAKEDAQDLNFGAGYRLEVTTPGVDLPLTETRHWRRNRGRRIEVDGAAFRIGALNNEGTFVVLISAGAQAVHVRAVSDLHGAVVEIEFNTPPAGELELVEKSFDQASELAVDGEVDK